MILFWQIPKNPDQHVSQLMKCFQGCFEILAWLSFTLLVVIVMCLIIYQDMTDMARHSINSKINLRPTSEVPFPAITITLSDASDPTKVAKQSGNLIWRDLLPQQGLSYRFEADVFMLCVITFTEFNTLLHAAFYKAMAACQGEMAETLLNQTSSIAGQRAPMPRNLQ